MQKEFEYLAYDEELTSKHVGGKKKIMHEIENKSLNTLEENENQACDSKQEFKHVGGKKKINHVTKNKSLNMLEEN